MEKLQKVESTGSRKWLYLLVELVMLIIFLCGCYLATEGVHRGQISVHDSTKIDFVNGNSPILLLPFFITSLAYFKIQDESTNYVSDHKYYCVVFWSLKLS